MQRHDRQAYRNRKDICHLLALLAVTAAATVAAQVNLFFNFTEILFLLFLFLFSAANS